MKMFIAGALLVLSAGAVNAQQIEWKQVQNTPKGLNLPQGVQPDILGMALGDTFDEVKPNFEKLLAEVQSPAKPEPAKPTGKLSDIDLDMAVQADVSRMQGNSAAQMNGAVGPARIDERETNIRFQVAGEFIQAHYVSGLLMRRELPAASGRTTSDSLEATFSAPSSGRQLYAITRVLSFAAQTDQPRISEIMNQLVAKLHAQPQVLPLANLVRYRFQFDNGKPVAPAGANFTSCTARGGENIDAASLRTLNASGDCDVVFNIEVTLGISRDHASMIKFMLGDNERLKANVGADFAYVQQYVRDFQNRSRGAMPKL